MTIPFTLAERATKIGPQNCIENSWIHRRVMLVLGWKSHLKIIRLLNRTDIHVICSLFISSEESLKDFRGIKLICCPVMLHCESWLNTNISKNMFVLYRFFTPAHLWVKSECQFFCPLHYPQWAIFLFLGPVSEKQWPSHALPNRTPFDRTIR